MDQQEIELLEVLEEAVRSNRLDDCLAEIITRIEMRLLSNPDDAMAWETIPLDAFTSPLPEGIESCWIFILRSDTTTGAERHPNSHQRSMSIRGSGDFQTRADGDWMSHQLSSEPEVPIDRRWLSIPQNVWHQLVVPDENWVLISFHTVAEDELVEERPGKDSDAGVRQMKYADREL